MSAWNSNGLTVRSVSGITDTVLATDDAVIYTNTAAKAVTIPDARTIQPGKNYMFSNQNTGAITLTPAAGSIDGAGTQTVAAGAAGAPTVRRLVSDGTNWFTV